MKYQLVVFDLDGTLADTSPGIVNSHRYAHKMMGRPEPPLGELRSVIGGPLLQIYRDRFGFSEVDARRALTFYRSYYAEKGIYEATLYPGILETLQQLRSLGVQLSVATLKAERFVGMLLHYLGILDFFSVVHGMDDNDTRTKMQMIQMCLEYTHVPPQRAVLVGDSIHDLSGARACGVSFLGVTYGFDFTPEIHDHVPVSVMLADNCLEIVKMLDL